MIKPVLCGLHIVYISNASQFTWSQKLNFKLLQKIFGWAWPTTIVTYSVFMFLHRCRNRGPAPPNKVPNSNRSMIYFANFLHLMYACITCGIGSGPQYKFSFLHLFNFMYLALGEY